MMALRVTSEPQGLTGLKLERPPHGGPLAYGPRSRLRIVVSSMIVLIGI
jgi:hypothetical protein